VIDEELPDGRAGAGAGGAAPTGMVGLTGHVVASRRPRGRTLAAAEARIAEARSRADDAADTDPTRPRAADPKEQAARFSSFRQAVRPNTPHPEEGNTR
ncbi:ATP-binding protein, partial [Streptomyces sp. NPDC057545]